MKICFCFFSLPSSSSSSESEEEEAEEAETTSANQAANVRFDELEVIQLIPVIIAQLKAGHVSEGERVALEQIFGDLWELIVAEAKRVEGGGQDNEMNPLLKTILESEEVRLAKRDITKQIGNDIYKNSIRRVYRGESSTHPKPPYISLDDDRKLLSPPQRMLNMVAAIVHKANVMEKAAQAKLRQIQKRKSWRRKNSKRQQQQQLPLGIVAGIRKPRQRFAERIFSINRMKRSIIKFGTDLNDMKALLAQINHANSNEEPTEVDEGDDKQELNDIHSDEHMDDYVDDDYYVDDDEYQPEQNDYSFDQLGWHPRRSASLSDDYENGSVNEFINLAKQRDRREKKLDQHNFQQQQQQYDEYYDDEGDSVDYNN